MPLWFAYVRAILSIMCVKMWESRPLGTASPLSMFVVRWTDCIRRLSPVNAEQDSSVEVDGLLIPGVMRCGGIAHSV